MFGAETTLVDAGADYKYVGIASAGALPSQPVWRIMRFTLASGEVVKHEWASGTVDNNKIWTNRASYFTPITTSGYLNKFSTLFDGINDVVNIPIGDLATLCGVNHSVSIWFKPLNTGTQYLWLVGSSAGTVPMLSSINVSETQVIFNVRDDAGNTINAAISVALVAGNWYNLTASRSGNTAIVYINGLAGSAAAPATIGTTTVNQASIGCRRANTNTAFFSGLINQLMIFDKSLTAAEAQEIWNGGTPKDFADLSSYANLKAYWFMGNGDTFPTISDKIGANHGTMANMTSSQFLEDVP